MTSNEESETGEMVSVVDGSVTDWWALALSIVTGVVALAGFLFVERRDRLQALTDLHATLTSGEIAQARHTVGSLLYSDPQQAESDKENSIAAYFVLVWALQRSRNVFRTRRMHWRTLDQPQSLWSTVMHSGSSDASVILTWNLTEIAQNVSEFHSRYGEAWSVADEDAWQDVGLLHG